MPGTTKAVTGTLNAPLLPGIYRAHYGYTAADQTTVQRSRLILYIPPWFILLTIGLVWLTFTLLRRKRRRALTDATDHGGQAATDS
jgi:hypothetical protein